MSPPASGMLDEAVAALVEPRDVAFVTVNDVGMRCLNTIEHGSLIETLREAVAGATGAHAGGASDPTTRIPINADALMIYADLESQVSRWFVDIAFEPAPPFPEVALTMWRRKFDRWKRMHPDEEEADAVEWTHVRQLRRWARLIEALFDPPKHLEVMSVVDVPITRQDGTPLTYANGTPRTRRKTIPATCPMCEESTAFDPSNGNTITAVVVSYPTSQEDEALTAAVGVCRSCEWTWRGAEQLAAMRKQMDEWEARHARP